VVHTPGGPAPGLVGDADGGPGLIDTNVR
jgi:hypothetical protein